MSWLNRFLMILAVCCLLTGCTPEQIEKLDRSVADANAVGSGVVELMTGPAGALFPPIVRTIAEVLGVALAVGVSAWQTIRAKLLKQTGSAIVQAIEHLEPPAQATVKAAVKESMKDREIYSKANAVVDSWKAG